MRIPLLKTAVGAVGVLGLAAGATLLCPEPLDAADHTDPPLETPDPAVDIGDLYAWHSEAGATTVVLTFTGRLDPGLQPAYDADVLYAVHFDTDGDYQKDESILIRFGQNGAGDWGVQVEGIPGAAGPLVSAVDEEVSEGDITLHAGLFDDPFFMDFLGFVGTVQSAMAAPQSPNLSFTGADFFAAQNIGAVIIEFPTASLGVTSYSTWATAGRLMPVDG